MYNYLKCKYVLDISDEEKSAIDRDWEKITFLCDPILGNIGEFLIRGNGELCHSQVDYEKVPDESIGEPGVIWNGTGYARIKSSDWVRVDLTGELKITTQIISKKTDASVEINFKFENGYVVSHKPNIVLIDNAERLAHDKKVKQFAIDRAKRLNSKWYRCYDMLVRLPIKKLLRCVGYVGSFLQDISWRLERQLNK